MFGIVIGSFLNVLIHRLPREMAVHKGHSVCPACNHRLHPCDLIPLLSFFSLGGKCRYCKEKIAWRYPLVEALNGVLYMAIAWRFGLNLQSVLYALIGSVLLCIAFIDWEHLLIPDSLNIALLVLGVGLLFSHEAIPLFERMLGAMCVSLLLFAVAAFSRGRAMGGGDIKLMTALGFCLGWQRITLTLMLGAVLGSLVLLALRKTKYALGRQVPFGTFLSAAGILSLLFGWEMFEWYIHNAKLF